LDRNAGNASGIGGSGEQFRAYGQALSMCKSRPNASKATVWSKRLKRLEIRRIRWPPSARRAKRHRNAMGSTVDILEAVKSTDSIHAEAYRQLQFIYAGADKKSKGSWWRCIGG